MNGKGAMEEGHLESWCLSSQQETDNKGQEDGETWQTEDIFGGGQVPSRHFLTRLRRLRKILPDSGLRDWVNGDVIS